MRMWMVPPRIMCRKHLLGEHVELHMLVGSLRKGRSIEGFLQNRLLEPSRIYERHAELVDEMTHRGMRHKSPLPQVSIDTWGFGYVDVNESIEELRRRCADCRCRHDGTKD